MFLELTSDGQPMLINVQTITSIRPLNKGEAEKDTYKTLVLFADETGQYVDQHYRDIATQVQHAKVLTAH